MYNRNKKAQQKHTLSDLIDSLVFPCCIYTSDCVVVGLTMMVVDWFLYAIFQIPNLSWTKIISFLSKRMTVRKLYSYGIFLLNNEHQLPPKTCVEICLVKLISLLTHWGRVTHLCVSRLTIPGSDNGLSPGWRQAIIWTNAGILLIGPLGTNFSENLIKILTFSFTEMRLKVSSAKWRPFCLGLNVLTNVKWLLPGEPHHQWQRWGWVLLGWRLSVWMYV